MKLLWLGPLFTDELLRRYPAALSPAGVRWNRGLADALIAQGVELRNLYHLPEPLWPRGRSRVAPPAPAELQTSYGAQWIPYWNLPLLRSRSLASGYTRGFRSLLDSFRPEVVVTYNFMNQNDAVGQLARRLGIRWINVLADVYGSTMDLRQFEPAASAASGHVFLSWAAFQESPWPAKLHLDGGFNRFNDTSEGEPGLVVYTGGVNALAGVELLAEAFSLVRHPLARLIVCGKGNNEVLEALARRDPRVEILGLVSDRRLTEICGRASALVNPRPSSFDENRFNFPSKLVEYLSYQKPVVSTWTAGLAPVYRSVLEVVEPESPAGLASALDAVLAWSPGQRVAMAARIRTFLNKDATWDAQAGKLLEWLATLAPASITTA